MHLVGYLHNPRPVGQMSGWDECQLHGVSSVYHIAVLGINQSILVCHVGLFGLVTLRQLFGVFVWSMDSLRYAGRPGWADRDKSNQK